MTVCARSYRRQTGFNETLITSGGRAYLVRPYEDLEREPSTSEASAADDDRAQVGQSARSRQSTERFGPTLPLQQWHGKCIHYVDPPRWVQKRRQVVLELILGCFIPLLVMGPLCKSREHYRCAII